MKIGGIQKLTLTDYPEKVASIIFTQGCNFKCPFCHNKDLLTSQSKDYELKEKEVLDYLEKRKGIIDGICISGGEPLIQKDIESFIKKVKLKGYKIKLDTNGSNPEKLKDLLEKKLIDYVAMDIKNDFVDYNITSGVNIDINNIKKSIEIIKNSEIDYEFRTTIMKELHDINKIKKILKYIGKEPRYFLQNYQECENVISKNFTSFDESELKEIKREINKEYPNVFIRGI